MLSVGPGARRFSPSQDIHVKKYVPHQVGNVHYRLGAERTFLRVCLGKVKSDALPDQLIAFTRCLREARPIKYRDLPSAALNQTCAFQLPSSNGRSEERRVGKECR